MTPAFRNALLWVAASVLMYIAAMSSISAAYVDGHFVPDNQDAFYHARRVLDAVMNDAAVMRIRQDAGDIANERQDLGRHHRHRQALALDELARDPGPIPLAENPDFEDARHARMMKCLEDAGLAHHANGDRLQTGKRRVHDLDANAPRQQDMDGLITLADVTLDDVVANSAAGGEAIHVPHRAATGAPAVPPLMYGFD